MTREVAGLYKIIPLKPFRRTEGVSFDILPMDEMPGVDGVDRVIHVKGAVSPGPVGDVERPWYMHPFQQDQLLVLQGIRYTDIYTPSHGKVESFEISPDLIKKNGKVLYDGPAILVWFCGVFHRIRTDERTGSASVNLATRYQGFDINTNFSVYDVDTDTGGHRIIREGSLDQN